MQKPVLSRLSAFLAFNKGFVRFVTFLKHC